MFLRIFIMAGFLAGARLEFMDYCLKAKEGCQNITADVLKSDASFSDDVLQEFKSKKHDFTFNPENVKFILFTKDYPNPEEGFVFTVGNLSKLIGSKFYNDKMTKIFIHGWYQNGYTYASTIPQAYFQKQDVNVIMVDWGFYSDNPYIFTRILIVEQVGKTVAAMLDALTMKFSPSFTPRKVHIIGHSMGSHVSGFAGKHIRTGAINRITALDPAGPAFRRSPIYDRLNMGDAEFVDVIHTDGMGLGYYAPFGNVDFYPNTGLAPQAGCAVPPPDFKTGLLCSHQQSVAFFQESITSDVGFFGEKCPNKEAFYANKCSETEFVFAVMGEYVPKTAVGTFYLKTKPQYPYANGRFWLHHKNIH